MKVLLSYPSEFDKGEGVHFSRVLKRLGHEVLEVNVAAGADGSDSPGRLVRGYPAVVRLEELLKVHGPADLYLYIEPLGLIPFGLETSPIPTACVLCDVHRNLKARQTLAKLFDHVFLYQRNYLPAFGDHPSGAVHWLPYACDTETFKDLGLTRDLDVAFIGQLFGPDSERRRLITALASKYKVNEQRYYLQREIPETYSRAKIVVNIPLGDDLNFRFFEALSCGALLLTRRISNGQEELFQEGTHYAAYDSERELFEKVEYYLKNEEERKKIAAAGHEETMRAHTLTHRVETLLNNIRSGPKSSAPARKLERAAVLRIYAHAFERAGRVEALLWLAAEKRRNGSTWQWLWMLAMGLKSFMRRTVSGW